MAESADPLRVQLSEERRSDITEALVRLFDEEFDEELSPYRAARVVIRSRVSCDWGSQRLKVRRDLNQLEADSSVPSPARPGSRGWPGFPRHLPGCPSGIPCQREDSEPLRIHPWRSR